MENYFQYFAEIIKASSAGPLGILALLILVTGVLAYHFFRNERAAIKLTVFFTLVGMSMVSFAVSFYKTEVFIPSVETTADAGEISELPEPVVPPAPSRPSITMAPSEHEAQPAITTTRPSARTLDTESDTAVLSSTDDEIGFHMALPDSVAAPVARRDCGAAWTDWMEVGKDVGNPCPENCTRGEELGQNVRMVGFPPRPQLKHKFQCWK